MPLIISDTLTKKIVKPQKPESSIVEHFDKNKLPKDMDIVRSIIPYITFAELNPLDSTFIETRGTPYDEN